jgi:arginyl-tRNA---protein transferase
VWDPDLRFLSLGVLSALKEIAWVAEEHAAGASMHYSYLGFYIHSCQKMRCDIMASGIMLQGL